MPSNKLTSYQKTKNILRTKKLTGKTGKQGPKGSSGKTGKQGPKGPPGRIGRIGPKGMGKRGPPGRRGPSGPRGVQGEQGPRGVQGEQGPPGPQGSIGPRGPEGLNKPFIGEIRLFGGNFAPRDWILCEGQLLSITDNTALFSILGTTYGGDGRTTFGLPDLSDHGSVDVNYIIALQGFYPSRN